MPKLLPKLELTKTQVAWALSLGQTPSKLTIDQLRYLLQVGVPFSGEETGVGRGNHLLYGFHPLIECGLALYTTRRGMKPGEAAHYLLSQRKDLRRLFSKAWHALPEAVMMGEWVKSRGRLHATLADEQFLRMHSRYSETPGKIESLDMKEAFLKQSSLGDLAERFPDGESYLLVPLSRLMVEWVAWALEAPAMKRGRGAG